jgi:hypothetical protein
MLGVQGKDRVFGTMHEQRSCIIVASVGDGPYGIHFLLFLRGACMVLQVGFRQI